MAINNHCTRCHHRLESLAIADLGSLRTNGMAEHRVEQLAKLMQLFTIWVCAKCGNVTLEACHEMMDVLKAAADDILGLS